MKTQSNIIITFLFLIIFFNACNTKTSSQFNNYNIALDTVISGYDSKDLDIYTEAQHRIISNINIYDKIQEDTLLSPMERENLIDKLSNASLTWYQVNHIFTKIIFTPDDNDNIIGSIEVSYINHDHDNVNDTDSITILQIYTPEEMKNIQVTLADWEQDSICNEYYLNIISLEHGSFISRLKNKDQKEFLERDVMLIYEYIQEIDSCYIAASVPLKILQKQLKEDNME